MSTRNPSLQEVIGTALDAFSRRLPVALPAKVVKVYSSPDGGQKVDCKILVQRPYFDEEDERKLASIAVVTGVPVQFPGASALFRFTFPISDGNLRVEGQTVRATTGVLLFCDRAIAKWLTGDGGEVDPEIDHTHDLSDAVFLPGLNPFGAPLQSASQSTASIGSDSDGNGRIHFKKGEVQLGDGATKGVNREGDAVDMGTLTVNGVGSAFTGLTWVTPDGVTHTIGAGTPTALTGKTKDGSEHIKAVD